MNTALLTPHRIKLDLDWICSSPPLLKALPWLCASPLAGFNPPVEIPCPQELALSLQHQSGSLLGIYYERLWQALLEAQSGIKGYHHNLQVQDENRTIGEYDLLYWPAASESPAHRELAVKFYLQLPDNHTSPGYHCLVGPNTKDRLDLKLSRLLTHQIQLSRSAAGALALTQLQWPQPRREILLQGRFFYPWKKAYTPIPHLNPEHLQGAWITAKELPDWLESRDNSEGYWPLERLEWLGAWGQKRPVWGAQQLMVHIQQHFYEGNMPLQIMVLQETAPDALEVMRLFIVADNWLEQSLKQQEQKPPVNIEAVLPND